MTTEWTAPAKLTLNLRITGVRPDGYHEIESVMVTLDLADTLVFDNTAGSGLDVVADWPQGGEWREPRLGPTGDNLVTRALAACHRTAGVTLVKRIPPGAGLGGGSADAAAVLRWAGCADVTVAASLGADVPFCLFGGRALVTGIGEVLTPLPFESQTFVLALLPFGVDTGAVYRVWDAMSAAGRLPDPGTVDNELEAAAVEVEPELLEWRSALEAVTGRAARLAGSGSTWFVECGGDGPDRDLPDWLEVDGRRAPVVVARTTPGHR